MNNAQKMLSKEDGRKNPNCFYVLYDNASLSSVEEI